MVVTVAVVVDFGLTNTPTNSAASAMQPKRTTIGMITAHNREHEHRLDLEKKTEESIEDYRYTGLYST